MKMKNNGLIFKTSLYSAVSVLIVLYLLYLLFYKVMKKHLIKETIVELTDTGYLFEVFWEMRKTPNNVINRDTWSNLGKKIKEKLGLI